jgi:ribosomal protein S18 acetylase RimI-like enzyme
MISKTFNSNFTERQIQQLLYSSKKDPLILEFTSDKQRFADLVTFKKWSKKTPHKYIFTDENNDLFALVWFSHKKIPVAGYKDYHWSLALRVYEKARGKGLAKEFMSVALKDFSNKFPDRKIWLSTSFDNLAAIRTYKRFNFKQISKPNEDNKILMIL